MKRQQGFIQVPILIAIVLGVLVVGGGGYVGVKEYQKSQDTKKEEVRLAAEPQLEPVATTSAQSETSTSTDEVALLRQEIERLKQLSVEANDPQAAQSPPRGAASPQESSVHSEAAAPAAPSSSSETKSGSGSSRDAFCQKIVPNSKWTVFYGPDDSSAFDDAYSCECPDGFVMNNLKTICLEIGSQPIEPTTAAPTTEISSPSNPAVPVVSTQNSSDEALETVDVVSMLKSRVAQLECFHPKKLWVYGSGFLHWDNGFYVYTNAHVVEGIEYCFVWLDLKNGLGYKYTIRPENFYLPANNQLDLVRVSIRQTVIPPSNPLPFCKARAEIGERIVVLGWPLTGSEEEITATDGIISGYKGRYYTSSVKIERGNSGGVAVSLAHGCLLGMPTYVVLGSFESMGYILDYVDRG